MKKCSKCKIEQPEENFQKRADTKKGIRSECLNCVCLRGKAWREKNKEKISAQKKEYRKNNKEAFKKRSKDYYERNIDKISKYRKENIKHKAAYNKEYQKKRLNNDPLFRLSMNIRRLVLLSFKNKGLRKNSKTAQILGCSFEDFKIHIEKQFVEGMNWDNRSKWHIDHIIPLSIAKTEQEVIKLNHYTNLRPLWAEDNIKKGARIIYG